MKLKHHVIIIIAFGLMIATAGYLAGCSESVNTNPSIQTNNMLGYEALVELPIGECLYYDYTTGIVYWWNGFMRHTNSSSTTPTPYYSPNGLLYRYIPETGCLEEIKPCYKEDV
jgi:hypothetical protein